MTFDQSYAKLKHIRLESGLQLPWADFSLQTYLAKSVKNAWAVCGNGGGVEGGRGGGGRRGWRRREQEEEEEAGNFLHSFPLKAPVQ